MLILTRRVGESIVVGDDIVLTVFEVRGDAVRVGIEAPRSVQVHRQEVYDELKRLNEQSVSPSDDAVDALRDALEDGPSSVADESSTHRPELAVVADPEPRESAPAKQPRGEQATHGQSAPRASQPTPRANQPTPRASQPTPRASQPTPRAGQPAQRNPKPGPRPPSRP